MDRAEIAMELTKTVIGRMTSASGDVMAKAAVETYKTIYAALAEDAPAGEQASAGKQRPRRYGSKIVPA